MSENKYRIDRDGAVLVVVDVQERLAAAMERRQEVVDNCRRLVEGAGVLGVPVILTEQYPKGLGPTEESLRGALAPFSPIEKLSFSCAGEEGFHRALEEHGRRTVLLAGMETHVCVMQTCLDLLDGGRAVHVASDAVCSRTGENRRVGLEIMRDAGAVISSTETILFQLLGTAGAPEFKAISRLVR